MQHVARFNSGIIHYSTNDAVFRHPNGNPIAMEFHRYCGPMFTMYDGDGGYMPIEDTPAWDSLWRQFYGWWDAKGKSLYT